VVIVAARLALLAIGCAAALACSPDFQSARQVTDLRVLAIRQEALDANGNPSPLADAFVDFAANAVQPVAIRALVVDPHARQRLSARGSVCPPTDSGRCEGVPAFEVSPPFLAAEPGPEQQPEYRLDVSSDVVRLALQDDRLKGFGGIRVQFSLSADDGDPHGPVEASKILVYTAAPESSRNGNPGIEALEITQDGANPRLVAQGETLPIRAGVEYGLRPLLKGGPAGIEEYDTVDLSGKTVHLREAPRYSFFSTSSIDVDRDDADEPLLGQPQPANGIARFSATPGKGSLWVVVRDGRGGIGWISVAFDASAP
jgi:hypothetical protein